MLKVSNNPKELTLNIPTSKSYINRSLIRAALNPEKVTLNNINPCDDVLNLKKALECLEVKIVEVENDWVVENSIFDSEIEPKKISIGDGGTTFRFFLALTGLVDKKIEIELGESLATRPNDYFYEILKVLGLEIRKEKNLIIKKGIYDTDMELDIDCSVSTQFYSALKLISDKINLDINPENITSSRKYIELTDKIFEKNYDNMPADFSSAAYALCYDFHLNKVNINEALIPDPLQSDSMILEIIEEAKSGKIVVDCSRCLDLFPPLIFLASYMPEGGKFRSLKNLKFKESDRLSEGLKLLELFKVQYELNSDELVIFGKSQKLSKEIEYFSPNDHRMAMTAYLFLKYNGGGILHNVECINKSYPNFISDFEA